MMLYPAMKDLLQKVPSRYELVNVVAHAGPTNCQRGGGRPVYRWMTSRSALPSGRWREGELDQE